MRPIFLHLIVCVQGDKINNASKKRKGSILVAALAEKFQLTSVHISRIGVEHEKPTSDTEIASKTRSNDNGKVLLSHKFPHLPLPEVISLHALINVGNSGENVRYRIHQTPQHPTPPSGIHFAQQTIYAKSEFAFEKPKKNIASRTISSHA